MRGVRVDVATANHRTTFEDTTYYLCSAGCLERFEKEPTRFVPAAR